MKKSVSKSLARDEKRCIGTWESMMWFIWIFWWMSFMGSDGEMKTIIDK
jgi:hypothetical protein